MRLRLAFAAMSPGLSGRSAIQHRGQTTLHTDALSLPVRE